MCSVLMMVLITLSMKHVAFCDPLQDVFELVEYNTLLIPRLVMAQVEDVEMPGFYGKSFPETNMNAFEIIHYYEYPAEQYDVTTDDGYILTIQRIPFGRSGPGNKPRQPVIVQHGFLCSSAIWVFNTPKDSLGFILADAGYDVWLTNIRGNTYGRKHVSLNPKQKEFWEFSFDEMGRYDMPALVDFVLAKTGFSQTNYIGHSMGTTIAFVMLAERPEYNNKIRSLTMLAPVISTQHMSSPLARLKPFRRDLQFLLTLIGEYEILANSLLNRFLASAACVAPLNEMCSSIIFIIGGYDSAQLNLTRLPVYLSQMPAGASVQTLMHYLQLMDPGFRRFDFGESMNMKKYGQPTPPLYNMQNVMIPVSVFWSENDVLADPQDVGLLVPQIPNLTLRYRVPYDKFTHQDFLWAIDAKPLLYNKVVQVIRKLWRDDE